MVLAGNKLDLEEIREVPVCEAYTAALRLSSAYVETSAQEFTNVQDVFSAAVVKTLIPDGPKQMRKRSIRRLSSCSLKLRRNSASEESEGLDRSDQFSNVSSSSEFANIPPTQSQKLKTSSRSKLHTATCTIL